MILVYFFQDFDENIGFEGCHESKILNIEPVWQNRTYAHKLIGFCSATKKTVPNIPP